MSSALYITAAVPKPPPTASATNLCVLDSLFKFFTSLAASYKFLFPVALMYLPFLYALTDLLKASVTFSATLIAPLPIVLYPPYN